MTCRVGILCMVVLLMAAAGPVGTASAGERTSGGGRNGKSTKKRGRQRDPNKELKEDAAIDRDREAARREALEEAQQRERDLRVRGFEKSKAAAAELVLKKSCASFTDDIAALDKAVTLTDAQKKTLATLRADRDATLKRWNDAYFVRFAQSQALLAKMDPDADSAAGQELVKMMQALVAERAGLMARKERKMFAALTLPQRATWNAPILAAAARETFVLHELSEARQKTLLRVCNARVRSLRMPLQPPVSAALVRSIRSAILSRVLTPSQRSRLFQRERQAKAAADQAAKANAAAAKKAKKPS